MKNISALRGIAAYIGIWLLLLLWFWVWLPPDGAMLYSLASFYFMLPASSFFIACVIKTKHAFSKWLSPAFFGSMAMLLHYFTFSLANMRAFRNTLFPDVKILLVSAVPSLLGLCFNKGVAAFRKNKN